MTLNEQVSFKGDIYLGTDIINSKEVAIKVQRIEARYSPLDYEFRVYQALAGSTGIPAIHWFGIEASYNAMVIDLLGPSLEDLFEVRNCKFSLKTVLLLVDQLVRIF